MLQTTYPEKAESLSQIEILKKKKSYRPATNK